jgi:hypothetical protein
MKPVYTSRARPAASIRQRIAVAPRELRAAVAQNAALVTQTQQRLQLEAAAAGKAKPQPAELARRALAETQSQRQRNLRDAMQRSNARKAGA